MSVLDTNDLNRLLGLKLPNDLQAQFREDLIKLVPPGVELPSHGEVDEIIKIVDMLTCPDPKRSLNYLFAKTSAERAKALFENNDQEMIDKIYNLLLSYCKKVPEIEQIFLEWHK